MAFTGRLGTTDSQLGNIVLGAIGGAGTVTDTFTANAVVKATLSASFLVDAVIVQRTTDDFTANAVVHKTQTASFTADAVLLATQTNSFAADAVVAAPGGDFSADAIVLATSSASFTTDALLQLVVTDDIGADAVIKSTVAASLTADAVFTTQPFRSFSANAELLAAPGGSFSAKAYILIPESQLPPRDTVQTPTVNAQLKITLGGINITGWVQVAGCEFTAASNGGVGRALLPLKDVDHELNVPIGAEVIIRIDGRRVWGGFALRKSHRYYFDGDVATSPVPRQFVIEAYDYNLLLTKRFLFDPATPTRTQLKTYDGGTDDDVIIKFYLRNYTLLVDEDDVGLSLVEHVGTPERDSDISGAAGWSVFEFLRDMSRNVGSIFYLDPDRNLVYTDVDTPSSSTVLTDNPSGAEVGVRELEIENDGTKLVNDALVWGAGQGSDQVVFARNEAATSITNHGRWQQGQFLPTVWRQATVNRIANTIVNGSPQNKRGGKNDAVAVRCVTWEHGLRIADKVTVRADVFGYEDVLPIRQMRVTFPGGHPKYELVLSHEIDLPWTTFEFWFPEFSFDPPGPIDIGDFWNPDPFDPCASIGGCTDDFNDRTEADGWGTGNIGEWIALPVSSPDLFTGNLTVAGGIGKMTHESGQSDMTAGFIYQNGATAGAPIEVLTKFAVQLNWDSTNIEMALQLDGADDPISSIDWIYVYMPDFVNTVGTFADHDFSLDFALDTSDGDFDEAPGLFPRTNLVGNAYARWDLWARLRLDADGTVHVRIWEDGDPEPGTWTLEDLSGLMAGKEFPNVGFLLAPQSDGVNWSTFEVDSIEIVDGCIGGTVGEAMGLFGDLECGTSTVDEFDRTEASGWGTGPHGTWQDEGVSANWEVDGSKGIYTGSFDLIGVPISAPYPFELYFKAHLARVAGPKANHAQIELSDVAHDFSSLPAIIDAQLTNTGTTLHINATLITAADSWSWEVDAGTWDLSSATREVGVRVQFTADWARARVWDLSDPEPTDWFGGEIDNIAHTDIAYEWLWAYGINNTPAPDLAYDDITICGLVDANPCDDDPLPPEAEPDSPCAGQWIEETLTQIDPPPGRPTDRAYFQATHQWSPSTEDVFIDGLLVYRNLYIANYLLRYIEFDPDVETTYVGGIPEDPDAPGGNRIVTMRYFATCIAVVEA